MYECCPVTNVTRATRRGFLGAAETGCVVATGAGCFVTEAAESLLSTAGAGLRSAGGGGGGREAGARSGSGDWLKCHPRNPHKTRKSRSVGGILSDRTSILRMDELPGYHRARRAEPGRPSRQSLLMPSTVRYVRG